MKLSMSNIAWSQEDDIKIYQHLSKKGFGAIEIAPTRLVTPPPYSLENIEKARDISQGLKSDWGLDISSMQSILYGVTENIFGTPEEFSTLVAHIKSAIDFSAAISCPHIVFGCPKNRIMASSEDFDKAKLFFQQCSEYASKSGVTIGLEANPAIYGTNFLNHTREVLEFVKEMNLDSLRMNLDIGTILINSESLSIVEKSIQYISHVHVSEPNLDAIKSRSLHDEIFEILCSNGYNDFVSIEMRNSGFDSAIQTIDYIGDKFS